MYVHMRPRWDSALPPTSLRSVQSVPGCLDSLAVFTERLASNASDSEVRARLTTSRLGYLRMLQRVDPLRRGRYRDLAHDAGTHSTAT